MLKRRPTRRPTSRLQSIFGKKRTRTLRHETLERRELLAAEVLGIRPDNAGLLQDGDVLNVAPREFNIFFKGGADLDQSLINSNNVQLIRAGGDGDLATDPIVVQLGYVGFVNPQSNDPSESQRLVMRPASNAANNATTETFAFPDDLYQIRLDASMLASGVDFALNFRLDRGAQVLSVIPQPISRDSGGNLVQASNQVVIHFDNQVLNRNDAEDPSFFRLFAAESGAGGAGEQTLLPQQAQYDADANTVTLTFASDLPEGTYRLEVGLSDAGNASLATAVRVGTLFNDNFFTHNGFIGDSAGRSDDAGDLDFYRYELAAGSALNVTHQPHGSALQTRARVLDAAGNQLADNTTGSLTFPVSTAGSYFVEISSANGETGSYRLASSAIGNPISLSAADTTFAGANQLGTLGAAGISVNAAITPQSIPLPPYPGGQDEPGHRRIQREAHIGSSGTDPALPRPTVVRRYYFPLTLGPDPQGGTYLNLITEEEKRIVRAILDIYASVSGYEFIESTATNPGTDQLMIGKGDLRALDPSLGPGSGVAGLGGSSAVLLNGSLFAQADRFYGDGFTGVMFHEIGHALGLGHSYEIPSIMGEGVQNDVLPGDHDIVHLQRLIPPNSTDIDMYRFEVDQRGRLSAETFAERLSTPSLLNSVLKLYRQLPDGSRELVASNDRYFGNDSFIGVDVEPGVYFIGVSSTGNDQYDPNVPDSGFGGTTNGNYRLELRFDAERGGLMRDADGTAIDGNSDGTPGGVHQFWFQAGTDETTLYVDRVNDPLLGGTGGDGSLQNPFDRISKALAESASRIVVPLDAWTEIQDGDSFMVDDGDAPLVFTFGPAADIDQTAAASPQDLAQLIAAEINTSTSSAVATAVGRVVRLSGIDRIDLDGTPTLRNAPNVVRIVGNGGADGDISTPANNFPYLIGLDDLGNPLRDGAEFQVPQGVTVMLEAGALIKMRRANIDAGTSSINLSRAGGAIQVLGVPGLPVWLRSFHDDSFGGDSDGPGSGPRAGDFGGIVFRGDSDLEEAGIFLNHVTHADIRHGGGRVFVDSDEEVFTPIHIVDARPTLRFNHISAGADAAISANPNSFADSDGRIGPDIVGNFLQGNSIDGLFIRIRTELGTVLDRLTVPGRFDNSDITHVLSENLVIAGSPGGPLRNHITGAVTARAAGRLVVDPGVVLKFSGSRIEAERGASTLIAEGTENRPVIFTSIADDRYGGSGSFDTNRDGFSLGTPGNWGGLYFGHLSSGSIDNAMIAYGGGDSPIEGGSANFNVIEVHQASLRITNSEIRNNASGNATGQRSGRGANQPAVIYVRGSQPVIVDNKIVDNAGPVVSINASALTHQILPDPGRATGLIDAYSQFDDNHGPLVRLNRLSGNAINGMLIRGEELTTESVWDDTDIVHVLTGEIRIDNHHTYSGLRLQSSNSESLVVKLSGANAGITATGTPLDIIDRIGGTVHVLGTPGFPVVLTHLADDSVGAGFAPDGTVMTNTNNSASPTSGSVGGWRGLLFDQWSNDRNVAIIRERENPLTAGQDINRTPSTAQPLGVLAPNEKSGDENRRLGFEVHGWISPDDPGDVDVYSFRGTAGTPIWIDIDRTDPSLDAIVEVINASGTVLARSVRSGDVNFPGNLNAQTLTQNRLLGGDFYTQNFRDPGMFYVLPGTPGTAGTYFIRVRSNPQASPISQLAGKSSGKYQLQIRLQQVDEFPGSTVQFADIRFAQTGIDVRGLPRRSPLVGEAGEDQSRPNNTFAQAQPLTNLLETDMAAINIAGRLANAGDIDWYEFDLRHVGVQEIGGVNDAPGTVAVVLDMNYADQAVRADTTLAVFDQNQRLIFVGRESNIADDQPLGQGTSVDDLSRGSLGKKDPYIGPIHLIPGQRYFVAVMNNRHLPAALTGAYMAAPELDGNRLTRLEPINSVRRVVEDHIGFSGYSSNGVPVMPETQRIFDISSSQALADHVVPFRLEDVVLYVATDHPTQDGGDHLYTVNPGLGERYLTRVTTTNNGLVANNQDVQDIVIRSDGMMYGYRQMPGTAGTVGQLVRLNPEDGSFLSTQNDNIRGNGEAPNVNVFNANQVSDRADQFTTRHEVDALTFERRGTTGPATAPVPFYDIYYVVRESDSASKLYRARPDGNAAPQNASGNNPKYGFLGYIQTDDVSTATTFMTIADAADPANATTIRLRSKIPGAAGNGITVNITNVRGGTAAAEVTGANLANGTINLRITRSPATGDVTAAPTAADIVNAINNHNTANQLVTAVITAGNSGTQARFGTNTQILTGGDDGAVGPIAGRVTGLAFNNFLSNGNLYGVTTAGELLEINKNTGSVINRTVIVDSNNVPFQFEGLALGPQNVNNGAFANAFFAVTSDGRLVAFDSQGNVVNAFDSGDAGQLITVSPGADGFFTLTFDNGNPGGRFTTLPIPSDAPTFDSINERQTFATDANGGTFSLSFERDRGAVTSLRNDVGIDDDFFIVQDATGFPSVPFVIQVGDEQMRVNGRSGNTFLNVDRGINGTDPAAHLDTASVLQVVTSPLTAPIGLTDETITVLDASVFPTLTQFNIRIGGEDMRVVGRSGNEFTVVRNINGTSPAAHSAGAVVSYIETTSQMQFNATGPQVQSVLLALPSFNAGEVLVSGGPLNGPSGLTVEFRGRWAARNLPQLTADVSNLRFDEIQRITLNPLVNDGEFQLSFGGEQTGLISFDAEASTVQAELEALPAIGPGNVLVTGGPLPGELTVRFQGDLENTNVPQLQPVPGNTLLNNERQQIAIGGSPTDGTFTLTLDDPGNGIPQQTTDPIPFDADAAAVAAALEAAIPELAGNIEVTGGPLPGSPITVEFINALGNTNVAQFTVTSSLDTGNVTVTTPLQGNSLSPVINTLVQGGLPVSVPISTVADGKLSVRDALIALPTINAGDLRLDGNLQDQGVTVRFGGQYAGVDVNPMEVNNFRMQTGEADVEIVSVPGDGTGDDFAIQVSGMSATPIGLAFSPLDFNLWHPTMKRGNDEGHGINPAPDASRAPGNTNVTISSPGPGANRTTTQAAGGASLHFGFEQWVQTHNAGTLSYLTYETGVNAQLGIRTTVQHQDLSSNPDIINTYNFPGGALGSLVSGSFSLAGSVPEDRPTLYFNYFLDTENHDGSNVTSDVNDPFSDSARVFASRDGGNTWELVATNNSQLSAGDRTITAQRAELPGFLSHLSDAGLNSQTARAQSHQIVQELMDSTGAWRQARVDLSTFAGQPDVMLRFDFSTAGAMRDTSLGFTDANFGEFRHDTRSIRSLNNQFEGFYIDDIIVGYAERGEMVTGAPADSQIFDLGGFARTNRERDPNHFPVILVDPYQLEIRRVEAEYAIHNEGRNFIIATYGTNDRHVLDVLDPVLIDFESSFPTWSPQPIEFDGTTVPALAMSAWSDATDRSFSPNTSLRSGDVNNLQRISVYQATAEELGGSATQPGVLEFYFSVSSRADTHGLRFFIDGVPQPLALFGDRDDGHFGGQDTLLVSGEQDFRLATFNFSGTNPTFTWVYDYTELGPTLGANRAWIDDIRLLQGGTGLLADRNRHRPQGMFIIDSNTITDSSIRGINVQPGVPQSPGMPVPGSTINFPQLNQDRLVPGVVIQNNIIAGSPGIRYAGETTTDAQRPVPFGRIVNNTLVGAGGGVGVLVEGIASPTVMNNIIADFQTGISGATGATTVRSNYFQGNAATGPQGTDAIIQPPDTPLFVDAANGNYYLVAGSPAVDSSLNVLQDRFNYVNFKNEIGIPPSPIFAPDRDVFGQLRIDSGQAPGGGGASVFKDRGAVDRADLESPFVVLLDPIDNDITGIDRDPNRTVVLLQDPIKESFSFLLTDGRGPNAPFEGTGIDPQTVSPDVVSVRRNNMPLTEGVDFVLGFNESTGEMRLTPLSTLWEPSGVYEITLDNDVIADRAGNLLRANQPDGSTRFHIVLSEVLFDFGDAPNSFGTLLESDGARHALINDAMPRLGRRVDTEVQAGSPAFPDDTPSDIAVTLGPGTTGINVDGEGTPRVEIQLTALPDSGDSLTVDVGNGPVTFEFVPIDVAPQAGSVAVRFDADDSIEEVTASLLGAIDAQFAAPGDAFIAELDADSADTIVLQNFDDEDGVGIATLDDGNLNPIVFVRPDGSTHPEYPTSIDDADDVLGFLNPLDPAGALIAITVTGTGFLDAWIDYNGNGVFDTNEKIFDSVPVVDGLNIFKINPPAGAADGVRWARFRISPEGGLQPTGLAVGGEVEDYQVQVIRIALPDPQDDTYTMLEDSTLDTAADGEVSVMFNDIFDVNTFTNPTALIVDGPQFAADFSFDPQTGHFVYTPLTDFSGLDTFTYRVALQQSAIDEMSPGTALATVTIDVRPVNDPPFAEDQAFITLEDTPVTITAEELLADARPHVDPQYPPGAPAAPWDESNQTLRVISIDAGSTTVTAANAGDGPFITAHGQIEAVFDDTTGWLVSLTYLPNLDQNRDTVTLLPYNGGGVYDLFQFTVEDDGELIDPVDGSIIQGTPLTHTATATIDVAPQNDDPIAEDDLITVGSIGAGTISPIDESTAWSQFFIGSGLTVPIPGEDSPLMIPADFLLQNDLTGPLTATDENQLINDGPLRIIAASINNRDATVELVEQDGEVVGILLTPPSNIYGRISFTYTIEDQGIDEDIDGNRVLAPRTAVGTVTVDIQPVNDPPNVPDRELRFTESADPGPSGPFTFTAEQLLDGSGNEGPAIPGPDDPTLGEPFDESEQSFRIVAFRTMMGSVDVNDLPGGTGTLTLASDAGGTFEFDFAGGAFTEARFVTAPDYNERTPFAPFEILRFTIEDDGLTTDPDTGVQVALPPARSEEDGVLRISITQANDAPIFTLPSDFVRDENDGSPWVQANFVTGVAPGPLTALDELERQGVTFSFAEVNVPAGMMTALPTITVNGGPGNWPGTGTLTVFPAADAFGFAVYDVTATDTNTSNPQTTTKRLTITINPINDVPVAFDRELNVVEAVEEDGEVAVLNFDAARLIQGAGSEQPSVPGAFPETLIDPYNETEQSLRVVRFEVPGANPVDVDVDEPGLAGGTGTVTRTTVTGGTLTFTFADGAFVSGSYAPTVDYNERTPFQPTDPFSYVISDDGRTTLPGSGFVNFGGSSSDSTIFLPDERSAPATVTITVTQANDPPIFTMPEGFTFDENEGQAVVQANFVTGVAPGPLTALDELERQGVTFSFSEVNVPAGMMTALPTITVNGGPGNWPGTGTLTVFPAADAFGFAVYDVTATDSDASDPRTTTKRLTITINPINDIPVAFNRSMEIVEAVEADGEVAIINFDAARLIQGAGSEQPNVPGAFPESLIDPYNESEQSLRVVRFEVPGTQAVDVDIDEPGLTGGTGTVTRVTETGGTLTFTFADGAFVSGSYAPAIDYNERTPFQPTDPFSYVIADDGRTTLPGSGFVEFGGSSTDSTIFLPEERSVPATVTLRVIQANDPPVFDFQPLVNILERDDNGDTVIANWATNIAPAPATALDELARQTVSFEFIVDRSQVPDGLFRQDPIVSPNGTLTLFPVRDAVGTAIVVMEAVDFESTPGFQPRRTAATITVNVQPVNDPPVHDPATFGTSASLDPDTAWQVNASGTIIYTLREDNTQPDGDTSIDYFIPLNFLEIVDGYSQIGLLDVFLVGPPNEADDSPGGNQTLSLVNNFPRSTNLGGMLTPVIVNGQLTGLNYRPPQDANLINRGVDHFTYTVTDDGQTYVLGTSNFVDGQLVDDPRTANGRVELRMNPVNDRPEFVLSTDYVEAAEDTDRIVRNAFATGIAAGPPTATDERSGSTAQTVSFVINPLSFERGGADDPFGETGYPRISTNGQLTFQPLPDEFGLFVFEVLLVDSGPGLETGRGDLNTSLPQTLTIQIQPVNDPPFLVDDAEPLEYQILEDHSIDIPLDGFGDLQGLLDNFRVGPPNEAADSSPLPGGNQTLSLDPTLPTTTLHGGTLTPVTDADGNITHLRYTPRPHFVGIDSFGFTVVDDGVTVDLGTGGEPRFDPRTAEGEVTINVLPVNDPPQFSFGGDSGDVTSVENQGTVTVPNWAVGVQAGPQGADDELSGIVHGLPSIEPQSMEFIITMIPELSSTFFDPMFTVFPFATIEGNTATLTYETAVSANGVAVFEVRLRDDGPNDPARGDVNTSEPQTFTITVGGVNDPPQFTPGGDITVLEDSGPFSEPWASDILPGPPTALDELATQTVSFSVGFEVIFPETFSTLFTQDGAPRIDDDGVLHFTPADNAAGEARIEVIAVDSEGGRSEPFFFTIFILNVNDPPVAGDITFQGDEDNVLVIKPEDLLAVAVDPDLETNPDEELTVTDMQTVSAAGAVIRVNADGDFEYDPRQAETLQRLRPGEFFNDTFTYRVVDAAGEVSNLATITVRVAGINDAPFTNPVFSVALSGQATVIRPLDNDFDIDGEIDPTTVFITRQPSFGSVVVRDDGTLVYTSAAGFRGQDIIRYTVADDLGQQSEQATITISVADPPMVESTEVGAVFGEDVEIDATENAVSGGVAIDPASIEIVTPPENGTVFVFEDGRIVYRADEDFFGIDSFQYRISDIEGRTSDVVTVTVSVSGSPLQNPIDPADVNNDGLVTPFDALLILNRLSRAQREGISGGIPVEMLLDESPRRFYDVDGNGRVEPLDALKVIFAVAQNNRNAASPEGEAAWIDEPLLVSTFETESVVEDAPFGFVAFDDPIAEPSKVADFDAIDDDTLERIAVGRSGDDRDGDEDRPSRLDDAVWNGLF